MKKGLLKAVSLSLVVAMGLLAGCGTKPADTQKPSGDPVVQATPETKKDEPKTVIKYWTQKVDTKDLQTELINKYNETNPDGIQIELNVVTDKYSDIMNMAFASGENPDVFVITGPSWSKKIMENQWGEPLDQYMTPEFKNRFREGVWVNYNNVYGGKTYTIPDNASTYKLVYNKDLFAKAGLDPEKAPLTFAELRDYAAKITKLGGGIAGLGLPLGDNGYNIDVTILNGMGMNAIGSLRGYDYKTGTFDYSVYKPLLQTILDIKSDGSMPEGLLLMNNDQAKAKFAEGMFGMFGAASWDPANYAAQKIAFEIGVADFPTIDGTAKGKANSQIGSGFAMATSCKAKDKAWKVIEFIFSKDFMGPMVKKTGSLTLLNDIASDPAFKTEIKYVDKFTPKDTDAVWPPIVPGLKLQGDNVQVVFSQIISGNKTIDEGLAELTKRYNDAFEAGIKEGTFKKEDFVKADFDPLNIK